VSRCRAILILAAFILAMASGVVGVVAVALDAELLMMGATLTAAALTAGVHVMLRPKRASTWLPKRSYFVDLLMPMSIHNDVQLNLAEMMPIWISAHGRKRAEWIRRTQIFLIVVGHYRTAIARMLGRVLRLLQP
jgi:hypothetical protein